VRTSVPRQDANNITTSPPLLFDPHLKDFVKWGKKRLKLLGFDIKILLAEGRDKLLNKYKGAILITTDPSIDYEPKIVIPIHPRPLIVLRRYQRVYTLRVFRYKYEKIMTNIIREISMLLRKSEEPLRKERLSVELRVVFKPKRKRLVRRPLAIKLPGIETKPLREGFQLQLSRPLYGGPEVPVIKAFIGSGGMAEVYLATLKGREVAVKLPLLAQPWRTLEREEQEAILREAELSAKLKHPNIVAVLAYGTGPFIWMAMELMEGGSLRAILDQHYPKGLPIREAVLMAIQLADALDYIHHYGIVHRDIKPGNVLFTADGVPKLADLGLAKIMMASSSSRDLRAAVGTLPYLAPEQLLPDKMGKPDWRTDIWQLGVVLYEALTGHNPFMAEAATEAEVIGRVLAHEPEPPSKLRPGVPEELDEVVLTALRKPKEERYQSAAELRVDLLAILDGLGGA